MDDTNVFATPQQNAMATVTLIDTLLDAALENMTLTLDKVKTMMIATAAQGPIGSHRLKQSYT